MEPWVGLLFGIAAVAAVLYWAFESRHWIVIANAACNSSVGLGPICSLLRANGVRYRTRTSGGGANFGGPSSDLNTSLMVHSRDRARARAVLAGLPR
ncbi:MAG TPA: hypothetical protein VF168_01470 [Trueperaceae bacterium]